MSDEWREQAACRGMTATFYPGHVDDVPAALEVCAGCPVRAECAQAGRDEVFGVWAGVDHEQRRSGWVRAPRWDRMVPLSPAARQRAYRARRRTG